MFTVKKASRSNVKLRIGFWGPSGSGKTMSALRFAKGLVGDYSKICILDTENGSGELYSHLGDYLVCPFAPPFSPQRYVQAINEIAKMGVECLIIDSISHEWEGSGGCLEIHEKFGGKFQDWGKVTPMHRSFIQAVLQAPFHVLVTGRSKVDYAMEKDDKNRSRVQKQGLKTVTREGFDYEMTLAFQIGHGSHLASIDKDRTNIFNDSTPFLITEEIGQKVCDWNKNHNNYFQMFKQLGKEKFGSDKEVWAAIKDKINFDTSVEDQSYWKNMVDELNSIPVNFMEKGELNDIKS